MNIEAIIQRLTALAEKHPKTEVHIRTSDREFPIGENIQLVPAEEIPAEGYDHKWNFPRIVIRAKPAVIPGQIL